MTWLCVCCAEAYSALSHSLSLSLSLPQEHEKAKIKGMIAELGTLKRRMDAANSELKTWRDRAHRLAGAAQRQQARAQAAEERAAQLQRRLEESQAARQEPTGRGPQHQHHYHVGHQPRQHHETAEEASLKRQLADLERLLEACVAAKLCAHYRGVVFSDAARLYFADIA